MGNILTKRRVLAAKVESVEGTAETLTASDAGMLVADLRIDPQVEMVARDFLTDTLTKIPSLAGRKSGSFRFRTEVKGAGAAYSSTVKPAWGKYLQACGVSETVDDTLGSESVVYAPVSDRTQVPSLTMALYNDGLRYLMTGCRGNAALNFEGGQIASIDFTFQGVLVAVTDASILAPDFGPEINLNPPLMLGTGLTLGGYSHKINSLSLDFQNELLVRPDMAADSGYISTIITDRNPTGTMDPEMVNVADYDFYGKWFAGETAALNFSAGDTQYNKFTFNAPGVATTAISDDDRNTLSVAGLQFMLTGSGDDEWTLTLD